MIIEIYIKESFVGRYIIHGHLYPRMHSGVEPSELLTIPRCFNMEIKSGSNEHPKTTILQMKILKFKKDLFLIYKEVIFCVRLVHFSGKLAPF